MQNKCVCICIKRVVTAPAGRLRPSETPPSGIPAWQGSLHIYKYTYSHKQRNKALTLAHAQTILYTGN